jgi:3'-5' exoribonuclease
MKLMKRDLKENESITTFFALESMQLKKSSKAQQNFLVLTLCDKTGKVTGYLWNDPVETAALLQEKSFVKVHGFIKKINDSLCINIERIRTAQKEEIDIKDFLSSVPGGVQLWHGKLLESVTLIRDTNCRRLIDSFLGDEGFMELFLTSPAGISVHHNYVGGLLEHTTSVMTQSATYADMHPALLDKDLLLSGAFIHDIGKTEEIYWEIAREYTTEGKLLGHIAIGFSLLSEKIAQLKNFPGDLALLLKHMILAHHGTLEYGSPVRPAPPEALVLHMIDNIDAKISHLYCHLGASDPNAPWSPYDKYLNTEIYRKKFEKNIERISVKQG